jgi:membrane protease YdiL (CAAX protease family)
MKMLKGYLAVVLAVALTLAGGVLASIYIKPKLLLLGLVQNWSWPAVCFLSAAICAHFFQIRFNFRPPKTFGWLKLSIAAFVGGCFLQGVFWFLSFRSGFHSHRGPIPMAVYFVLAALTEELIFRGVLQNALASKLPLGRGKTSQMAAAALVALPIGLFYGLNPVFFSHSPFAWNWALGTTMISLTAGIFYAWIPALCAPMLLHVIFNLLSFLT